MKTIEEAAFMRANKIGYSDAFAGGIKLGFINGVEWAETWIDVEDELPEANKEEEGIFYSDYVLIKVKGYEHPFIGYYVKARDDEFFDFVPEILLDIKQEEITHWRSITHN